MKIARMLILICFCVCLNMQAQTKQFIENYKKRSHQLVNKNADASLLYMPKIMNLLERSSVSFDKMPIAQRKENLFVFLSNPILANNYAFDIKGCRLFYDTTGLLVYKRYKGKRKMVDFSDLKENHVPEWAMLNYLAENPFDYIFTIENIGWKELFWAIKNEEIFALLYDEKNNSFQVFDVESFLKDGAHDIFFMNFGELCENNLL